MVVLGKRSRYLKGKNRQQMWPSCTNQSGSYLATQYPATDAGLHVQTRLEATL